MTSRRVLSCAFMSVVLATIAMGETLQPNDICSAKDQLPAGPARAAAIILDLTAQTPKAVTYYKDERANGGFDSAVNLIAAAVNTQCASAPADFAQLAASLAKEVPPKSDRWLGHAGDDVFVFVFVKGGSDTGLSFEISEKKRDLKIVEDLRTAAKAVKNLELASPQTVQLLVARYTLRLERANVTFSAKKGDKDVATSELVTGPIEHFSLSADLPVNSVKTLTFDDKTNSVQPKTAPKEFLAGVDYVLGDVFRTPESRWSLDRVVFKGLVRFSKQPLDTVGVAAGYLLPVGGTLFAGPIWIRETTGTGSDAKERYKMHVRVGIGFDIKKALDWLKK